MEAFNYQFTALRGIQAGREYYLAMCPMKLIPKIFLFDEEEIPPELRAQRVLNRARIPDITHYILDNPKEYVFSALTISIDGDVHFDPIADKGNKRNVGMLSVPMTARFLINDGQHRRAGIEEALKENPDLGDETIAVVFFLDAGLERSQQLFADLNKHAVRPTRSIGILYDKRDPFAQMALDLLNSVPIFRGLTETEKTTISNRSTKIFTLSAVYQATQALLHKNRSDQITKGDLKLAKDYWTALSEVIPEWRLAIKRQASAADLRSQYIHVHGVTLHALGIVGHTLVATYPDTWRQHLAPLEQLDWHRTNIELWGNRSMQHGKMSKAANSVSLTANAIKQVLGLRLTAEEATLEQQITSSARARGAA
jgi:DNA sulfur modification protein DndB